MKIDRNRNEVLPEGNLLCIKSSNMITTQGEILKQFLKILCNPQKVVFIQIHDMFSPWLQPLIRLDGMVGFWNEQHPPEVFLANSTRCKLLLGTNLLKRSNFHPLQSIAHYLTPTRGLGPIQLGVEE